MYESSFSYGLSRPYPFKWFTPVVIIGALVATALFSFLNVAATGYELVTVQTSDPNVTVATRTFFSNWPSILTGNIRPSCESKIIGVGNDYYTNNTVMSYKLERIYQALGANRKNYIYSGDLPYYNNALRDCVVHRMEIFFQGLDRSALQIARQLWGAELRAEIVCAIDIEDGSRMVKLSTTYDLNSPTQRFPGRNEMTKPSLWWGESLLAWNYLKLTRDMYNATAKVNIEKAVYKGYIEFLPRQRTIGHAEDYMSPDFFLRPMPGCFFVPFSHDGVSRRVQFCDPKNQDKKPFVKHELWVTADTIIKTFHSTILTDLGQSQPNIIVDPAMLEYYSKNISAIAKQQAAGGETWGYGNNIGIPFAPDLGDLALKPYTIANGSHWNLTAKPSSLSVTYLCQIPKLKGSSSLFFSVLVANLVFLQALWKLFSLIVDFFMYRKYPDIGSCQGCQQVKSSAGEDLELLQSDLSSQNLDRGPEHRGVYSCL